MYPPCQQLIYFRPNFPDGHQTQKKSFRDLICECKMLGMDQSWGPYDMLTHPDPLTVTYKLMNQNYIFGTFWDVTISGSCCIVKKPQEFFNEHSPRVIKPPHPDATSRACPISQHQVLLWHQQLQTPPPCPERDKRLSINNGFFSLPKYLPVQTAMALSRVPEKRTTM